MKQRLLDIVACPVCAQGLACSRLDVEDPVTGELLEGELCCGHGHSYPVINGIPRLLPPELLSETLRRYHPRHLDGYRGPAGGATAAAALKKETLRSFSYQWTVFSQMYEHWEANFRSYLEPLVNPSDFSGKLVLDAGCGFGRHAYYAAKYGAEVVAMDLSEAVEAARANTAHHPRVHVVQGDIYHPPLKAGFDLIYCIGVMQHLPDPQAGFRRLAGLLHEGGAFFVWVYGQRQGLYRLIDVMRVVSTRLPLRLLYWVTGALNAVSHVCFSLPYKALRRLPGSGRLAAAWPFTRYADLPYRVGHADWFDRLSVPSTVYFSKEEIEKWYADADMRETAVQSREGIGWRGWGRAAGGAKSAGTGAR